MTQRTHHFVPKCYLKHFAFGAKDREQVFTVDFVRGRAFRPWIGNVAAKRDFNRVDLPGVDPNALEKAYGKFETPLAEALERISASRSFKTEDDFIYVLNLMALLATRHPDFRAKMQDYYDALYTLKAEVLTATRARFEQTLSRAVENGFVKQKSAPITYEQVRDFVRERKFRVSVDQDTLIRHEVDVMDPVLRTMAQRSWMLLIAPEEAGSFITSDNPVCLISTNSRQEGAVLLGHAMAQTAVLFPLSRSLALYGTYDGDSGSTLIDRNSVRRLNGIIMTEAYSQVYAPDSNFEYLRDGDIRQGAYSLIDLKMRERFNERRKEDVG
ncbi:DUF4238 domain-containing protein [Thalassospira sp.]|uniref:DUF4238 domain-containing protein n=1 Tax=Thalassospira sp. TaxID=1912094 RepID=UPI001AFE250D|nr:DUF4238 domain-containing protein [Thalassospira sp.]MBO6805733.1 DUF4238 domain-containing protein [Thalassospira sp.]MBO6841347.1 DUF4238 domain-containing protein [Thalassospira sp.]